MTPCARRWFSDSRFCDRCLIDAAQVAVAALAGVLAAIAPARRAARINMLAAIGAE